MQGSDQMVEVEELGVRLSTVLHCPVHYPAFGKRLFECKCNIIFPAYVVLGRSDAELIEIHKKGIQP